MSRTQFSFTFTNAQPGSDVHFSAPIYADATTPRPDGPTLVLDSSNAVSVWADAGFLVATTVDGIGQPLSATALATSPSVSTGSDAGAGGHNPFGNGGSVAVEYLSAEASPGTTVTEGSGADVTGWTIDESGGSSVTLGEDGLTFTVAPGAYHYFVGGSLGGGLVTDALLNVEKLTGTVISVDWGQQSNFFNADGSVSARGILRVRTEATYKISVQNTVGGDSTIDYVGLDLIRFGDLAPAN